MEAEDPDYKAPRPTTYPGKYDYHFLEMMRGIYEATETYPLNPRDLSIQSAFYADMDFVGELNLHMAWHRHMKDRLKPKRGGY